MPCERTDDDARLVLPGWVSRRRKSKRSLPYHAPISTRKASAMRTSPITSCGCSIVSLTYVRVREEERTHARVGLEADVAAVPRVADVRRAREDVGEEEDPGEEEVRHDDAQRQSNRALLRKENVRSAPRKGSESRTARRRTF